jgi:phosphonate transport system ATP-binding protein
MHATALPAGIALRLERVSVVYPNGTVGLRDTTLDFRGGEFTVLLGASGAGKSTLLRSLNGLVPASTGRVVCAELGSIHERGMLRRHRQRCGMVFQQHQLIGRLPVIKNVLTGRLGYHSTLRSLLPLPAAEQRLALECLERVGMLDHALRRADQLSGGQQQRVGIARAIVQQPRVLLADEPVASLDPATARRVLALIRTICKEDGITAIVSLHQVQYACEFADRIIAITHGTVAFDGRPVELTEALFQRIYGADEIAEMRGQRQAEDAEIQRAA